MGILGNMWRNAQEESKAQERAFIQAQMTADAIKQSHTCKICKKIFSEGVPYQRGVFGGVKSYICKDCANSRGLAGQKKMGFGEAVGNLAVAVAQSRLKTKQKKAKGIVYVNGSGKLMEVKTKKGGSKEKRKSVNQNRCSKCKKGMLVTTTNQFRKKTIFKSFCPICGNTIKKEV